MRALFVLCFAIGCSSGANAVETDAGVDATATSSCNFNAECPTEQRCEQLESGGVCRVGARGAGEAGVDPCATGLDCASGVCVEGTSGFVCSGPCAAGCGALLPKCASIPPFGSICVREPPSTSGATGTFAGRKWSFDHAYFGHDLGDAGAIGTTLELQAGSDGTCPPPKRDPQATVVIANLPGALTERTYGDADGVTANLLGFDPALPLKSKATSVKVDVKAIASCKAPQIGTCGFSLTVSLAFGEGSIDGGPVSALRCASMDG